ncbi:MAG: hypothetical protein QXT73_04815 [Candidatus Methanomethylicaceae archaeon]
MTAQIPEKFFYKGELFDLVGIEGGNLVFPQDFGMEPEALHTACWRGLFSIKLMMKVFFFTHFTSETRMKFTPSLMALYQKSQRE